MRQLLVPIEACRSAYIVLNCGGRASEGSTDLWRDIERIDIESVDKRRDRRAAVRGRFSTSSA